MRDSDPSFRYQQEQKNKFKSQLSLEELNKHRLWKEVATKQSGHYGRKHRSIGASSNAMRIKTDGVGELMLETRKIEENNSQHSQNNEVDKSMSRLKHKKRLKCTTISNFLDRLQIDSKNQQDSSKCDAQSEILSILDVKYNQSICSEKFRNIADKKLHIQHLFANMKDLLLPIKQQIKKYINTLMQQISKISVSYTKLINKYQSQMSEKNIELKHLQLKSRQVKLNNTQSTNRLQSKLYFIQSQNKTLQNKNKQLINTLIQYQSKYKQSQYQNQKIKQYNMELNQMLIKYHKKIQDLQNKIQQYKKQHHQLMSQQYQKLTNKYQTQLKQQQQHYQLKLQNTNMKLLINSNSAKNKSAFLNSTPPPIPCMSNSQFHANQMSLSKIQDKLSNNSNNSYIQQYLLSINGNNRLKVEGIDQTNKKSNRSSRTVSYLHNEQNSTLNSIIIKQENKQQSEQSQKNEKQINNKSYCCDTNNKSSNINPSNVKIICQNQGKKGLSTTRTNNTNPNMNNLVTSNCNNSGNNNKDNNKYIKDNNDRYHRSQNSSSSSTRRFQRTAKFSSTTALPAPNGEIRNNVNISGPCSLNCRSNKTNILLNNSKTYHNLNELQIGHSMQQHTNHIWRQNQQQQCPINQSSLYHNNMRKRKINQINNPVHIGNTFWKNNKNIVIVDKKLRQTIN